MHVDANSWKSKVDQKMFGRAWSKNECGESGQETLDLTVSQEWIDEINWFFCMLVQVQES